MPVIFLKYRSDMVSEDRMRRLVTELPIIVSNALDVPDDPGKRLTPDDIQVWSLPADKFDVNTRGIHLMIPLHHYPERIANLEERKNKIVGEVRCIVGATSSDTGSRSDDIGWVWILPSSDTAFGRI